MNKQYIILALVLFFSVASLCAQTGGEKKGWPSNDRYTFIADCIGTAKKNMSSDTARFYCYCMQEKMEVKYPNFADANKITAKELSSPEWIKEIKSCLTGTWPANERKEFLASCVNSAKASLGETKATNYCECMMFKIEKLYPDPNDAAKITGEDFKTDYWQKLIKGCLDF